jgi:hypothetical protein
MGDSMPRLQSKNFDNAWTELIQKTLVQGSNDRPAGEGWKSVREFAQSRIPKITPAHARNILHDLVDKGMLEESRARIGRYWNVFYRPVIQSAKRSAKSRH